MHLRNGTYYFDPSCPCHMGGHHCELISSSDYDLLVDHYEPVAWLRLSGITGNWPPPRCIYVCEICQEVFSDTLFLTSRRARSARHAELPGNSGLPMWATPSFGMLLRVVDEHMAVLRANLGR